MRMSQRRPFFLSGSWRRSACRGRPGGQGAGAVHDAGRGHGLRLAVGDRVGARWAALDHRARGVPRPAGESGRRHAPVLLTMHEVHRSVAQDGLLGLAFHPDFGKGTDQVFIAFTYDDAPGPALARRLGIRRYRYDATARALVDPVDVLAGLPTHDDHVGGRIAVGPDRKLYLTIGDGGANFGGNRCMVNHAQTLPTAAQVSAKNWVGLSGQDPAHRSGRRYPERQPDGRRRAQPHFLRRPSQSAGHRLRSRRPALRVRARPRAATTR